MIKRIVSENQLLDLLPISEDIKLWVQVNENFRRALKIFVARFTPVKGIITVDFNPPLKGVCYQTVGIHTIDGCVIEQDYIFKLVSGELVLYTGFTPKGNWVEDHFVRNIKRLPSDYTEIGSTYLKDHHRELTEVPCELRPTIKKALQETGCA